MVILCTTVCLPLVKVLFYSCWREFGLKSSAQTAGVDVQRTVGTTNSPVKVEFQLCDVILAAHHQGLLQSLQVLHLQVLAPLSKCSPLHFFQKLSCLTVGVKNLLTSVHL